MLKIEDFLEKYNKELLKFNDKVDIFHSNFKENNKFKVEDVDILKSRARGIRQRLTSNEVSSLVEIDMSNIAYSYFDQLDTLELPDLEILSERINTLIFYKKKTNASSIESGLSFFDSIKGSVKREIDTAKELSEALDEKYAYSH